MKQPMSFFISCALLALFAGNANAYTVTGGGGTISSNGVVTNSPLGNSTYGYVTTLGGVTGNVKSGLGGTNGSTLNTNAFYANAGDVLSFYFNYVTSDGAGYADYGWADLLNTDSTIAATLFTARTTPGGDTVPGFGMPTINATLTPTSTPIIGGAPTWSALGQWSGKCWSTGCGYTDWIHATYTVQNSGNYLLQMGVANWWDEIYDTGMAFDGITIAGNTVDYELEDPSAVPLPAALPLMLSGLGVLGFASRRRKETV